ncbi:MAG: arsenate reductase family protein [Erysipelotrichaceae bacterium]|nr:arsenate reductase family protein [Erysipelotrichaceae bacterium]
MIFVGYPKCSTSRKAEKWLQERNISYDFRDITIENPSYDELKEWHQKSGLDLKRFYNTSGRLYKSMNLKDQIKEMSEEEQYRLLSTDGLLVKRPIVIDGQSILVGFKEQEWIDHFG